MQSHPSHRPMSSFQSSQDAAPASNALPVLPDGDILSCIVFTKPGKGSQVAESIAGSSGVEVHCGADIDKLVVTIEDVAGQSAADRLGALNGVEGVVNTILIYHFGGQALAADPAG